MNYFMLVIYEFRAIIKPRENIEELVLQTFSSNSKLNILINFSTLSVKSKLIMPRHNECGKTAFCIVFACKNIFVCLLCYSKFYFILCYS